MQPTKKMASKIASLFVIAAMMVAAFSMTAFAAGYEDLEEGTYTVDAELSCYVYPAMGGIEFGKPLLQSTTVTVNADGTVDVKLSLGKGQVIIYGVTAYTFIDANYPIGYKSGSEWKTDAAYTLSSDTAPNPSAQAINYVDSMTIRLPSVSNVYDLMLYINSNTMGIQFGGTGSYSAKLTIDWASAEKIKIADETATQSAIVNYSVTGGYEVKIPAAINVDTATKTGAYSVEAQNFVISEDAYVTVTADTAGSVSNGTKSLTFTNELTSGSLKTTGDKLDGTVTITGNPTAAGSYTGTLEFTINYFAE